MNTSHLHLAGLAFDDLNRSRRWKERSPPCLLTAKLLVPTEALLLIDGVPNHRFAKRFDVRQFVAVFATKDDDPLVSEHFR